MSLLRTGLLLSAALVAAGLALPASAGSVVDEVRYVDTVDGAKIRVEIERDTSFDAARQPVILSYSPYHSLNEPTPAHDAVAARYVPKGYARAVADVLGTRGSTGCWDYGGAREQQSGADVVRWLANQPWSNGRVGMTGVSYEGTTANMVAALGSAIDADSNGGKGLAGVVPIAAISRWYGYAYQDGVRFFGNSKVPTDEGFDTPLGFDLGFGRTVAADPAGEQFAATLAARTGECGAAEHTEQGYSRSPDYGPFWQQRDYRRVAANWRTPVLLVHGWQDFNVKQEEGTALYDALPVDDPRTPQKEGVPFKRLWMTQSSHANGSGTGYQDLLDAFWARTLKGIDSALLSGPPVTSLGRTVAGPDAMQHLDAGYPVPGTTPVTLHAAAGALSLTPTGPAGVTTIDAGTASEEVSLRQPAGSPAWAYLTSAPLPGDVRMVGSAQLHTTVTVSRPGQSLTPLLVEQTPDGVLHLVERGFLNLDYRKGLATAQPDAGTLTGTVRFLPQDYTFTTGSRIGLLLQGSNTVWAVPGNPGTTSYGATSLTLPLVTADGSALLAG